MSGTVTTPVCTIDATGIHAPVFADCLTWATSSFQAIYGSDVYLGNDSPDGQLVSLLATAINDTNAMAVAVYSAFSPNTAQGTGLSSVVKINGIARKVASYSTVDLLLIGQFGIPITNGIVTDQNGNQWQQNAGTVTIPSAGQITVGFTCLTLGAIAAPAGTINKIKTITYGWQSATNVYDATEGAPVETDATLRVRQQASTANPSQAILDGITGALLALDGVTAVGREENETSTTNADGIPGNSIAFVVAGGDPQQIANTIATKKTPGAGTYGNTSETYIGPYGVNEIINFSRPVEVAISVAVYLSVHGITGYTTSIGTEIQAAIQAYINDRPIAISGDSRVFRVTRLYVPAQLAGPYASPASVYDGQTYEITNITVAGSGIGAGSPDIALSFGQQPAYVNGTSTISLYVST